MTRWTWWLAALAVVIPAAAVRGQNVPAADELTDEHVRKAIAAIVEMLYEQKNASRFWEPGQYPAGGHGASQGGWTALTVLALLYAGESYQDPRLRDALRFVEQTDTKGTYAVALRTLVWAMLPDDGFHDLLADEARRLMDGFSAEAAGWTYTLDPRAPFTDNSNTQMAALALWEAAKREVKINPRIWERLEQRFVREQRADGGWGYGKQDPPYGSMTTAGLGLLFITQEQIHAGEHVAIIANRRSPPEQAIAHGLDWLESRFSATENPGKGLNSYDYYLYGLERVALASGYRFFHGQDWYRQGAAQVIRNTCRWDPRSRTMSVRPGLRQNRSLPPLRFALLFLSRGRFPVAINKLRDDSPEWNNRPRDVANLTRWISDRTEMALNWQIVGIHHRPDEWLTAPLLYVASSRALSWFDASHAEVDEYVKRWQEWNRRRAEGAVTAAPQRPGGPRLGAVKEYLDLGGMILAVDEGETHAMARSMQAAGRLMYPQYQWQTVGSDQAAYTMHFKVPGARPHLSALSNGVRDLIVLAPGDFSRTLQLGTRNRRFIWNVGANIYFYASENNRPRPRLAPHVYREAASGNAAPARHALVVRAIYGGNWNPEPEALRVFAAWMRGHGVAVRIDDAPLSRVAGIQPRPDLVIATGVEAHTFTEAEGDALRSYVGAGGTVLFETAGGRGDFALSAEQMAASFFGVHADPLVHDRLVSGRGLPGGCDLTGVEYRPYSFEVFGGREDTLRLRGAAIDGRTCLLFSREDISHGLLDQPCWGIHGYAPQSARAVLCNVLLRARAGPDTAPDRR